VFERLGYAVSGDGSEFVAERKWRSVRVRSLSPGADGGDLLPDADAGLHCLVTWMEHVDELREQLLDRQPAGDWAIIGVDDDGNHEVHQAV